MFYKDSWIRYFTHIEAVREDVFPTWAYLRSGSRIFIQYLVPGEEHTDPNHSFLPGTLGEPYTPYGSKGNTFIKLTPTDTDWAIATFTPDVTAAEYYNLSFIDTSGNLRISFFPDLIIDSDVTNIIEDRGIFGEQSGKYFVSVGIIYEKNNQFFLFFRSGLYWHLLGEKIQVKKAIPFDISSHFISILNLFNFAVYQNIEPQGFISCRALDVPRSIYRKTAGKFPTKYRAPDDKTLWVPFRYSICRIDEDYVKRPAGMTLVEGQYWPKLYILEY